MSSTLTYDINIFVFFMFIGIIVKLFFASNTTADGSSGPATAAVWGYGVTAASIIGIMFVTFAMTRRMEKISNNSLEFVKSLFMHSMVPMLTLGILVWLISINAQFYNKINKGAVANDYYTYSGVSTFLLIIQIVMLYRYIQDELRDGSSNMKEILTSKVVSVTYLLTLGNAILLGIMTIILHYFSTDG